MAVLPPCAPQIPGPGQVRGWSGHLGNTWIMDGNTETSQSSAQFINTDTWSVRYEVFAAKIHSVYSFQFSFRFNPHWELSIFSADASSLLLVWILNMTSQTCNNFLLILFDLLNHSFVLSFRDDNCLCVDIYIEGSQVLIWQDMSDFCWIHYYQRS